MHIDLETLSAHIDDDLDAPKRALVLAHLESCAACRGWVAELDKMRALSTDAEGSLPARDLWPTIVARVRRRPSALAWLRSPRVAWGVAVAMAAVAVVLWLRVPDDPYSGVRSSYLAKIEALLPRAQASRARLPEKSRLDIIASLELVDHAIADCERAIAEAPADPFGQEALLALYDEKLRVLRASIAAEGLGGRP